jgi:hypothetical protein
MLPNTNLFPVCDTVSGEVSTKGVRMNRARVVIVLIMLMVLAGTLAGAFLTRGVMTYLPFLQPGRELDREPTYRTEWWINGRGRQRQLLAALAQSAEERELAREAERLADHEVDQAFSQSLRQASLEKPNLSGKALALQQRVNELQETIKNDRGQDRITQCRRGQETSGRSFRGQRLWRLRRRNLASTKTNWTDSIEDLARESGDQRIKLQQELAARQAAMKQYRDSARRTMGKLRSPRPNNTRRCPAAIDVAIPPQPETTDCAGPAVGRGRRGRADRRSGKL